MSPLKMTMVTNRMDLGESLQTAGLLNASQLELAVREQRRRNLPLSRVVVELGFMSQDQMSRFMAHEAQAKLVDINRMAIDKAVINLVPLDLCRGLRVLPISRVNGTVTVAMADPLNVTAVDTLRHITNLQIEVATASEQDILNFIDALHVQGDAIQESIDQIIEGEVTEGRLATREEVETAAASEDEAPIIRLVSQIIVRAVNIGASDVHFEPEEKLMRIRTRIDGVLHPDVLIPNSLRSAVCSRLKILADMDVAETRLPQDGRATVFVGRRQINLRVSSLPTCFGENVVVRILNSNSGIQNISSLKLAPPVEAQLREAVDRPHGVIVVTGPTGSGKSTTLYALLKEISSIEVSTFTLEDPIEYRMLGIRQTQIREDIGLTFSTGLRTLLRQDPDIILVGETRDTETAQLMVRAALTGHLVFTTLHTNDAPGAIPRLLDMGVEPFLLPESLIAVLAQRLVRRVCPECKEPVEHPAAVFSSLKIELPAGEVPTLFHGKGCLACSTSGYRGRQGIFELMMMDRRFHEATVRRAGSHEFSRLAREGGMQTMFEDGLLRVIQGTTTIEEVLRATRMN